MSNSKIILAAAVLAVVVAGFGGYYSSEDAPDNITPESVCEDNGFKTNGKARTVTIEGGDTVSSKATAPLADELGVDMTTARKMIEDANPGVYDLDKVGIGAVINIPNCAIEEGHG